jgi:hypothetical protein
LSLSPGFFRGADATLFVFDVNQPATLRALTRRRSEFYAFVPLRDEDIASVVGKKTDVISGSGDATVSEDVALHLIDELVLRSEMRSSSPGKPWTRETGYLSV